MFIKLLILFWVSVFSFKVIHDNQDLINRISNVYALMINYKPTTNYNYEHNGLVDNKEKNIQRIIIIDIHKVPRTMNLSLSNEKDFNLRGLIVSRPLGPRR